MTTKLIPRALAMMSAGRSEGLAITAPGKTCAELPRGLTTCLSEPGSEMRTPQLMDATGARSLIRCGDHALETRRSMGRLHGAAKVRAGDPRLERRQPPAAAIIRPLSAAAGADVVPALFDPRRLQGNHLFLPLGLLHRAPLFADAWPPRLPWAGGAVVVEQSTAAYFLEQGGVPGEVDDLTPRAVALLKAAGHRGRQFFSVAKRFSPWSPRNAAGLPPGGFLPFTIPAFELRRLISEGTLGPKATLAYSRDVGKPRAQRTTVHVTTDKTGAVATCKVKSPKHKARKFALWARSKACAAEELALLPPVPATAMVLDFTSAPFCTSAWIAR